jgi:hypothetical protein
MNRQEFEARLKETGTRRLKQNRCNLAQRIPRMDILSRSGASF